MPVANKFIRGLEGNMRLRVNNKPIPDYVRGFRNPVPPPRPGGGGIITKIIKFGGKLLATPLLVLLDFFGNQKGFSDGTLPDWVKQEGNSVVIQPGSPTPPFTGGQSIGVLYNIATSVRIYDSGGNAEISNANGQFYGVIENIALFPGTPNTNGRITLFVITNDGKGSNYNLFSIYAGHFVRAEFISIDVIRADGQTDTGQFPSNEQIETESSYKAGRILIDQLSASDWKFSGFTELPTIKPGKITKIPDFFKLPKITKKPAVIPTEIPQPIPDYDLDQEPDLDIFPDPEPVFVPTPRPKIIPEPIINPDPQPDVNPKPDPTPKPEPKWTKITKYIPQPKEPIVVITKPPIVLDKTPKPLPDPQPVKPPPPIQTPIDKCVDHCGGGGTIDFELPDDSELLALLKAIKKKVDEIEESVNQTLEGEIEVGSCEIPKDISNQTDELVYTPDPAKKITYSDKGLRAINLALSGVQTKLTSLHEEFCQPKDIPNGIPEWWQVRAGSDRPQLVVIFKGGDSYWSMALPWYKGKFKEKIINLIPGYNRGNFSTILTLNDNSKIVVNASSKEEGERFMTKVKAVIKPKLLEQAELKAGGERKGKPLKTGKVMPVYAKYFATGQQNLLPDWRYNFKTQKFIKYVKPNQE